MIRNSLIALALLAGAAHAQTFASFSQTTTCYGWNGGNFSAGSFSQCRTDMVAVPAPKPIPVTPVALAPSPIMAPMSCPPIAEPAKPKVYKPKPKPKTVC